MCLVMTSFSPQLQYTVINIKLQSGTSYFAIYHMVPGKTFNTLHDRSKKKFPLYHCFQPHLIVTSTLTHQIWNWSILKWITLQNVMPFIHIGGGSHYNITRLISLTQYKPTLQVGHITWVMTLRQSIFTLKMDHITKVDNIDIVYNMQSGELYTKVEGLQGITTCQ